MNDSDPNSADSTKESAALLTGKYLRSIMNTVIDGVIAIRSDGTIELFNKAAEKIFGYDADEMIGENVTKLMPKEYADAHQGYIDRYLQTGEAKIIGVGREIVGLKKDGSEFSLYLGVSRFDDMGQPRFVGVLRDLTEFKEAEEAKRQKEILEASLKETQRLNRLRAFLAQEIRLPLADMMSRSKYLLGTMYEYTLGGEYIKFMKEIYDTSRYVAKHLDDLVSQDDEPAELDNTKKYEGEPFDVVQLMNQAGEFMKSFLEDDTVALSYNFAEGMPPVKADPLIVQQILHNILYHFIRVNKTRTKITFSAFRNEEGKTFIVIADDGRSLSDDDLKNLFEPPLLPNGKPSDGANIGLYLAKSLAQRYGVDFKVRREVEKGMACQLSFPDSEKASSSKAA